MFLHAPMLRFFDVWCVHRPNSIWYMLRRRTVNICEQHFKFLTSEVNQEQMRLYLVQFGSVPAGTNLCSYWFGLGAAMVGSFDLYSILILNLYSSTVDRIGADFFVDQHWFNSHQQRRRVFFVIFTLYVYTCLTLFLFVCGAEKSSVKVTEMGRKAVLANCTLNQWAMDFDGNCKRILKSKFACTHCSTSISNRHVVLNTVSCNLFLTLLLLFRKLYTFSVMNSLK